MEKKYCVVCGSENFSRSKLYCSVKCKNQAYYKQNRDELLESHLVSLGYAKVAFLYDDYKYNEEILAKEKEAKENNLGIWKNKEPIEEKIIEDDIIEKEEKEKDFFGVIGDFFKGIFNGIVDFFNGMVEDITK